MAITNGYATLPEIKAWCNSTGVGTAGNADDEKLELAVTAASRAVDSITRRGAGHFYLDTGTTARIYYPDTAGYTRVDDFDPGTAIVVKTDENDDGTFEFTWAATDYQLEPLNRPAGWAAWRLRAVGTHDFPMWTRRAPLEVTAKWGWPSVPDEVRHATRVIAEDLFKLKDTPFGVAGMSDTGVVRVRQNKLVMDMLQPLKRVA